MIASATVRCLSLGAVALAAALATTSAHAQSKRLAPPTPAQRATAEQVASQGGVPVGELAPNAPDVYAVKPGDTLWRIAGLYLKSPWRWPELWGMNMQAIANPHLIYPGQMLYLDKNGGYARLGTRAPGHGEDDGEPPLVRVSPTARSQSLLDAALPTLEPHLIEPFLAEPLIVDADTLAQAPRIVATTDQRTFMTSGDRAYARGPQHAPLLRDQDRERRHFRVFRNAVPLKDPDSGEILAYEAQYLGNAELVAGESRQVGDDDIDSQALADEAHYLANPELPEAQSRIAALRSRAEGLPVPASLDLSRVKGEIMAGDRLLPAPQRSFMNYAPHAPAQPVQASVVSIYGDSTMNWAAQSYVLAISRGARDGIDNGTVLELISRGERVLDKTGPNPKELLQLPVQRNGYAMVFLTFERVSYALVLQVLRPVVVGDILQAPQL